MTDSIFEDFIKSSNTRTVKEYFNLKNENNDIYRRPTIKIYYDYKLLFDDPDKYFDEQSKMLLHIENYINHELLCTID